MSRQEGTELSAIERQAISNAYNELLDGATTDVAIPTERIARPKDTVLGQIVGSLQEQKDEYAGALSALRRASGDRHALHEVLRIAYNFSTDVLPLMSLFMSICDLKPLVFWCTVDAQWDSTPPSLRCHGQLSVAKRVSTNTRRSSQRLEIMRSIMYYLLTRRSRLTF
jgi:hypothetical protein